MNETTSQASGRDQYCKYRPIFLHPRDGLIALTTPKAWYYLSLFQISGQNFLVCDSLTQKPPLKKFMALQLQKVIAFFE